MARVIKLHNTHSTLRKNNKKKKLVFWLTVVIDNDELFYRNREKISEKVSLNHPGPSHKVMQNNGKQNQNNSINQFEYTASIVSPRTPVLFSTIHGIHLRTNDSRHSGTLRYKLHFCDLERWQCNASKVNSVGLTSGVVVVDNVKSDRQGAKQKGGVKYVSESAGSSSESNVSK